MNYEIISTGSKGNSVIINDVLIDAGVPFNKIKSYLYDVKYLLITHIHSDHMNKKTLQQIAAAFPHIHIIGNYEVHEAYNVNTIANAGFDIETDDYIFTPFECLHDVLTYGYIWSYEGKDIIYVTDTSSLENAPDKKYDYFFIESNHDEVKLEAVRNQQHGKYSPYLSGKRHLSTQQAKSFYYTHRKSPEAEFIELHKSSRFY
jgi:phosphoribosyl 1,2-cyclic phosphodiesterase